MLLAHNCSKDTGTAVVTYDGNGDPVETVTHHPVDQDQPNLKVGPGAQFTDGTDVWCVHDDPQLDPPAGTTYDADGRPVPPDGWRFNIDGLTSADGGESAPSGESAPPVDVPQSFATNTSTRRANL